MSYPAVPSGNFPRRVSRAGTILFFGGLLLIGFGEFLDAIQTYILFTSFSFPSISSEALYAALGSTLILFGILLAGAGWILDQNAIAQATAGPGVSVRGGKWTLGMVLVALGVVCAAAWAGFFAYIYFAEYFQVAITLSKYSYPTIEVVLGFAFVLLAVGWLLQHLARLERIERRSP